MQQHTQEKPRLCFGCSHTVSEPYIRCTECMPPFCYLCLVCYASGKEFGLHENNHSYQVLQSNFPIFCKSWTASEELKLLEAIEKFGLGNWYNIASRVPSKSPEECKLHYFQCYIYSPYPGFPKLRESRLCVDNRPAPVPYKVSDAPPRPAMTSFRFMELAGYMPGRGDFVFEHDEYAEHSIKNVSFDEADDTLTSSLMLAAVEIFNTKLRERARRKCIIREYGLISLTESFLMSSRYSDTVSKMTIGDRLASFAKFLPAEEFYKFLEGLHLECMLKTKILNFQEYRELGMSSFYSVPVYKKLKRQQLEILAHKRNALSEVLSHVSDERAMRLWISKKVLKDAYKPVDNINKLGVNRKPAAPLDILGAPGYEKLNDIERELCSALRLVPNKFLHFKSTLVNEYQRCGILKLGQARSLIKIDVNKTRKIYNYLIDSDQIKKE